VNDKKADGNPVYKHILIKAILQTGKRSIKTELSGRSPLRVRRSALDCNVIEEEKEEKEEGGGGGGGEEEEELEEEENDDLGLIFTIL